MNKAFSVRGGLDAAGLVPCVVSMPLQSFAVDKWDCASPRSTAEGVGVPFPQYPYGQAGMRGNSGLRCHAHCTPTGADKNKSQAEPAQISVDERAKELQAKLLQ